MNRRGQWALLVALAAAAGLGAGLWHGGYFAATPAAPDLPGQPPPGLVEGDLLPEDLALTTLDGTPLPLSALRGRPLLINVWASWCGPCIKEMPELDRFAREQDDNGAQVLGLALDEAQAVRDFLRRIPVAYPQAIDAPGPADAGVRLGNPRGVLPYTALISADGRLLKQKIGPFAPGEIDDWVTD